MIFVGLLFYIVNTHLCVRTLDMNFSFVSLLKSMQTQQMKAKEHQQQMQMQQMHLMQQRNAHLQRRDPNHLPLGGSVNAMNTDGMMGKASVSTLGVKMQEEPMKHSQSMVTDSLLKSANNHQGYINFHQ